MIECDKRLAPVGGVWFCRRSDFQEIGGYDETVPLMLSWLEVFQKRAGEAQRVE